MGTLSIVQLFMTLVGICAGIVSLATTSWIQNGTGLIQSCSGENQQCKIIVGDDIVALAVACVIVGGLIVCLPSVAVTLANIQDETILKSLASGCLLTVSSILITGGVVTYTVAKHRDVYTLLHSEFGFSYYFGWLSGCSTFIGGVFATFSVIRRRGSTDYIKPTI